ncbi:MAG: threonine synthase [Chloroflexota bacterium]|nr:threonine synthase [Chloroflexota bacterium]
MTLSVPAGVIQRYLEFLPFTGDAPDLTIGEGGTPLVRAPVLEARTGIREVWLKLEGCNPTGSFKDRGMVVAVAKALEANARALICASTGNTAASAAAYGARAGVTTVCVVPHGSTAAGKLAQTRMFGARVVAVTGTFDHALTVVRQLAEREGVILVNSVNPHRLEGQKTAAFEIVDALGDAPDELYLPVGNAGNISAYWRGFVGYHEAGRATQTPVLRGFQAEGAAPIVLGHPIDDPVTQASAIRIGNPANWEEAAVARDASDGSIEAVPESAIAEAYRLLAQEMGVFIEPASAAGVAGLLQRRAGGAASADRVVCILTGSGLKDPDTALRESADPINTPPDLDAVTRVLGWSD